MRHFAIFCFILLSSLLSFAQDASSGAIRGTVTDLTGARIAGATVGFINNATGIRYGATTNSEGQFAFSCFRQLSIRGAPRPAACRRKPRQRCR